MPWSATISSGDVVAIHSALVPTANGDGEILLFGGDDHDRAANENHQWDHTRRFNCRHPTQPLLYVQSPNADLFCCGHAFTGDGRLLTGGGTTAFSQDAVGIHAHLHFEGHRRCFAYNPATMLLAEVASMNFEPGSTSQGGGRWYPSLCTLATGEVLIVAGHPAGDDSRHNNNHPERYQPLVDRWVLLAATGPDDVGGPDLFPRLHLLADGSVFVSSALQGNTRCIAIDPWTGSKREVCDLPNGDYHGYSCPSVLLPLTPQDGYRQRVLLCGGGSSQLLDLGATAPAWVTVPRNGATAAQSRTHASATILPTGDVLMTGGADPANDQSGVMEPELYHTPIDHATGTPSYAAGPGSWDTLAEPATVLRNYHSGALLMPDGRIWTAGGNSPTQPDTPPGTNQELIEIFDPPYPAGTRPSILSCPTVVAYGDQFAVDSPDAPHISAVTLLRCGSSTHAFNPDQRCIFLAFTAESATRLRVSAPPGGTIAPPGNYMLFLVDDGGRPCQYASFLRLGGTTSLFTDRSTFSQHEVEALLSGSTPWIPDAIYVVLDGFTQLDTAGTSDRPFPPTLQLSFEDDDSAVPGFDVSQVSSTLYESPAAPAGVAQRITIGYQLRFTDPHAFDGIAAGDSRRVRVAAHWGPTTASGEIVIFRREHVYSLDGPVSWLSIDVQVLQLPRGGAFAGKQDDDPASFIGQAIQAMRTAADDSTHPFEQLVANSANAALELNDATDDVLRDNFAFAKVRFRAPAGVTAPDVKLFFRMFTTAATSLSYDTSTVYQRTGDGPTAVALPGTVNGEIVSQPFFAGVRNADPQAQQDPVNRWTLAGAGAQEAVTFFGCWLDFNHDATIRNRIRGEHQCLVAEIFFPPSPIPAGATPADNDQLSQRNLVILHSDNPGDAASHTIAHTFDLKSSATALPTSLMIGKGSLAPPILAIASQRVIPPDELFLRWHGLPQDSIVSIYLPDVDVDQVLAVASSRPGYGSLAAIDAHTIGCRVGDATYLPLPGGRPGNIAGLLTIQLPPTVRAGETYRVTAHQISGRNRSFVASFELTIPVSRAPLILPLAQRSFVVLREIGSSIAPTDRWRPVFDRYLAVLASRLVSLGGDPGAAGPAGGRDRAAQRCGRRGWVFAALLALLVVVVALHPLPGLLAEAAVAIATLAAGVWWLARCRPQRCQVVVPLAAGLAFGGAASAALWLLGALPSGGGLVVAATSLGVGAMVAIGIGWRCFRVGGVSTP
jgi:hypothetical protein